MRGDSMSDDSKLTAEDPFESVFGPKPWGPALDGAPMIPAPVGEVCLYCAEPIVEGDSGISLGRFVRHRECILRHVVGSVGHQLGTCSCHGGSEEDPPGMTKRQAARAAVEFYERVVTGG
jgi:hypothetical protein